MNTRKIGSLEVSVVGLGANNFGNRLDYEASARVVGAALEHGINFLDTADIYGGTLSEEYIGRALAGRRDEVVIATKFGKPVDPQRRGARPEYVKQAAEDSLRRLATDYIDLYQIHEPDPSVPIEETLGALDELVRAGKVREIGCSNFSVDQLREARKASDARNGSARFVSVQNEYSLLNREPEEGVLGECQAQGLAFLPYFPLMSGLLTGKYRKGQPIPEGTRVATNERYRKLLTEENLDKVEALFAYASSENRSVVELAFSWLLAHPVVASVIAGASSAQQIRSNASAAGWRLSPAELTEIDEVLRAAV